MNVSSLFGQAGVRMRSVLVATLAGALAGCANLKIERVTPRANGAPAETTSESGSALDSQLAGLNRQIEARREYNATMRELVSAKEQELATVLARDRAAGPTVEEFELRTAVRSQMGKMDRVVQSWEGTVEAHRAVLKGASADPRGAELAAEISRLAGESAELRRQRGRLASINDRLAK